MYLAMGIFENISGFLFHPYAQCRNIMTIENKSSSFKNTALFVLYGSILLSILFVFYVLYPESLYYGVPSDVTFRNLLFINLSTPLILFLFFLIGLFLIIGLNFLGLGLLNYLICVILIKQKISAKNCRKFLSVYGYNILPLLIYGVFIIFWMFFFEKLYIATEIPPFIDLTLPNIISFSILFIALAWKWIIEARVNQAFFQTSFFRAIVPEFLHLGFLISFFFIVELLLTTFSGILEIV
jgi:hypothetical protein